MRLRIPLFVTVVATALLPAVVTAQAAAVPPASAPGWRTVAVVPGQPGRIWFYDVAVGDSRHAWAVGAAQTAGPAFSSSPVIQAWNGSAWAPVGVTASLGRSPGLVTAAAAGPRNLWAFTFYGRWLHFDGTAWTAGLISRRLQSQASLALGAKTAWVFGGLGGRPYAAYDADSGWTRMPVPGKGAIAAASAVSAKDIWAVIGTGPLGVGAHYGGLVHLKSGRWYQVTGLPARLHNTLLGSVLARSDTNVWVGGAIRNSKGGTTEAVGHWNGQRWTVTALRATATTAKFRLVSMVTDGSGGIWALGSCYSGTCLRPWRLWHEARGRWGRPVEPRLSRQQVMMYGLASSGHSVWAAGQSGFDGMIALWGPVPH